LKKILLAPPDAYCSSTVHHGLNVMAQLANQIRVDQVALNELGPTPYQVFDTFGATPINPNAEPLLQGEPRKAPANKAARAGDQNLHLPLRIKNI
jgi:hypothetical protein